MKQILEETLTVRPHKIFIIHSLQYSTTVQPVLSVQSKITRDPSKEQRPMGMLSTQGDFQKTEHKVLNNLHANEK